MFVGQSRKVANFASALDILQKVHLFAASITVALRFVIFVPMGKCDGYMCMLQTKPRSIGTKKGK